MFDDDSFDAHFDAISYKTRRAKGRRNPCFLLAVYFVIVGLACIAVLFYAALVDRSKSPTHDPALAARQFYQAFTVAALGRSTDDLARYSCSSLDIRVMLTTSASSLGISELGESIGELANISFDLSEVDFRVVQQSGDDAVVQMSGPIVVHAIGMSLPIAQNMTINMKRENGIWTVCDDFNPITP